MNYETNNIHYSHLMSRFYVVCRFLLMGLLIIGTHLSCQDAGDSGDAPSPDTPFTIKLMGIDNSVVSVSAILKNNQSVFKRELTLLPDQPMASLTLEGIPAGLYQLRLLINEDKVNLSGLTYEGNTEINVATNGTLMLNAPLFQDDCCLTIEWRSRFYYEHEEITGIFSANAYENYLGLLDNCQPIGKVSYLYIDKVIFDHNNKIIKKAMFNCLDCLLDEENIIRYMEQFQSFHQACLEEDWVIMDSIVILDYGPEGDGDTHTTFYQKWEN